jgi:hypothetical protein
MAPPTIGTPTAVPPVHVAAGPKQTVVSKHARVKANAKPLRHPGVTRTTESIAKRKSTNAQSQPRIFKEL